MSKKFLFIVIVMVAALVLGACQQIEAVSQTADFSQIESAEFYGALQATIVQVQIPVLIVGLISLVVGWKLGRFGLALNAVVIGGLMLYTYLADGALVTDENFRLGLSIVGAIIIGLLAYFLYNLMALIVGGAIGSFLMNGAWLQISDNVPPMLLVFATTFVSALVMFLVFRMFLVAFSAVIGAAILMLAVPYPTLWVIPVAVVGTVIQMVLAFMLKDDIFQNIRGDFGAAFRQAFGEVLGPVGTLRDYQKGKGEKTVPEPRQAKPQAKAAPKPAAQQQSYQAPKPAAPQQPYTYGGSAQAPQQPYQAPKPAAPQQPYTYGGSAQAPKPATPPQQQSFPPQQSYQPQPAQQKPVVPTPANPPVSIPPTQANPVFRPENYQIVLSTGQSFPLVGSQLTVGRQADNTIVVSDPQVSGYHLMLSIQAEGVVVWDNNTTNGSFLNGQALTGAYRLTTNDVLQVGSISLRLVRTDFQ